MTSQSEQQKAALLARCADPSECQGHLDPCTHRKGLFACPACVEKRRLAGRRYCAEAGEQRG